MTERYGIIVSKPGYDATTATSVSGLVMHDQIPLLKVKSTAKITIDHADTETIPHGLDYIPIVWVFMKNGSNNLVPVYYETTDTYAYVNSTNLVISNHDGATRDFYYYIFHDEI